MKILYFIDRLSTPGGIERVLTLKVNYLVDKLEYNVVIATIEDQEKLPFFELSNKVIHRRLEVINNKINNPKHIEAVTKVIFEEDPDICVSLFGLEIYFLHKINHRSIKIAEFHSSKNSLIIQTKNFIHKIYRYLLVIKLKRALKNYSQVVFLTKQDQQAWNLPNSTVIYNPLIIKRNKKNTILENKIVLTVGRISYVKGYDLLIKSWEKVHDKFPDWKLTILGLGSNEKVSLLENVHNKELKESVEILPVVKNVDKYYENSSIYVLSSRYEGFPMTLLEAGTYGLPIVAWKCPTGPSEIINHEEDGLLARYLDIDDLANKMMILMGDNKKRREYGNKMEKNIQRFTIDEIMEEWRLLFRKLK